MKPQVNLLPKYERYSNVSYILFIVGMIVCLLLAGALIYFYFTTKSELETTQANIRELTEQKTIIETRLNADAPSNSDTLATAITFAESYVIPTSKLIDELFVLLPENGYISNYFYDYNLLEIETQFEQIPDTANYVDKLTSSAYMDNVTIDLVETFEFSSVDVAEEETVDYNVIPRYNAIYSLDVNAQELVREEEENE